MEEKKRLESAMMHRDEELEEAQTAREEAEDRYKRTLGLLEQAQVDLGIERANGQRTESQRAAFEKQVGRMPLNGAERGGGVIYSLINLIDSTMGWHLSLPLSLPQREMLLTG